jgi:arginyl-tRNA synthetase
MLSDLICDSPEHGAKKLGKAIIVRKDGTPLYLTRDIGAITERDNEYHFDKMIYVPQTSLRHRPAPSAYRHRSCSQT